MADDDLDLDAMLDSALDEGFADPTAAQTRGEDDGDIDLDAMLDEAMVASVLDEVDGAAAAEKSRASSDFGPSKQWLQRKQVGRGNGTAAGAGEEFAFLRPERRAAWKAALTEDGQRQADMDKQRPFSRAYRSFYSAGKEEGGIVVHLGSGAAASANVAKEALQGGGGEGAGGGARDAEEGGGAPDDVFEDVLSKGVSSSGVKEPPSIGDGDYETLDRLKASYLRLVAKDVRARVCKDPDMSTERFPGISAKILTSDEENVPPSVTGTETAQGDETNASAKHDRLIEQQQAEPKLSSPSCERGGPENGEVNSGNMSVRYSKVSSADGSSPITEAEQSKRRRSQLADRISNKLHALFWALVGATVVYRTDFIRVLMEDERVDRVWFNIGVVCFSVNVVILAYLTVWLPHVRGIKVSWNVYSPRAIPAATVVGLICAVALNVSLWNVWGFLTPLILFAVFIGCLFSLHFVPWPC
eukprot:g18028.t2